MKITVIVTDDNGEVLFKREQDYTRKDAMREVDTNFTTQPAVSGLSLNGNTPYQPTRVPANFMADPPEEVEIEYKPNF